MLQYDPTSDNHFGSTVLELYERSRISRWVRA